MKKTFLFFGVLSPIIYITAVIAGGFLWPGYSHVTQPISELTADFAPRMPAVDILFFLANLSGLLFGNGVYFLASVKKSKIMRALGILLILAGIAALSFIFFPQDPIGQDLSFKGLIHLVLAGISSILTMAIVFTAAYAIKNLKKFSLIMGILIFISGGLTALATTNMPGIFGMFERITIGVYMLWLFAAALTLWRSNGQD